jgi:hypothetical protein
MMWCFIRGGIRPVSKDFAVEVVDRVEPENSVSFTEAENVLIKMLRKMERGGQK